MSGPVSKCEAGGCKEQFEGVEIPFGWFVQWSAAPGQPVEAGRLVVLCPGHRPGVRKPGEGG